MRRLILAALVATAPAMAQTATETQPRQKVVTVFGTEACPRSTDPNEIVVCRRRPADEQFRLPEAVRNEQNIARRDDVSATRAALVDQSMAPTRCTAAGIQGQAGCSTGLNVLGAGRKAVEAVTGDEQVPERAPQ